MERSTAMAQGLTKYNTGRPCKHGHHADRLTVSGACCECMAGLSRANRAKVMRARGEHEATFRGTYDQIQHMRSVWTMLVGSAPVAVEAPDIRPPNEVDREMVKAGLISIHGPELGMQLFKMANPDA